MDKRFIKRPLNPNYNSFLDQAYHGANNSIGNSGHFNYPPKRFVRVNHVNNGPLGGGKQTLRHATRGNMMLGHGFSIGMSATGNGRTQTKSDLKKQNKNLNQMITQHLNLIHEQNDELGEKDKEIELRDKEIATLCRMNKELEDELQNLRRQLQKKYKRAPSTESSTSPTQPQAKILRPSEASHAQNSNVCVSGNADSGVVVLQQHHQDEHQHKLLRSPMPLPHAQYNLQAETQLLPQVNFHHHHHQQQQQQQQHSHQMLLKQRQQREQVVVTSSLSTHAVNAKANGEINGRLGVGIIDNNDGSELKQLNQSSNESDIHNYFDGTKAEISTNIKHLGEDAEEGSKSLQQPELEIIEETHVVQDDGGGEEIYLDALDTAMTEEVVGTVNEEDNSSTGATVIEVVETQTVEITEVVTMDCDDSHVEYEQIVHTEKIMSEAVADSEEGNSIQQTAICIAESVDDGGFPSNAETVKNRSEKDHIVLLHDSKDQTAHFYPMVSVPTSVIANSGAIHYDTNSKNLLKPAAHLTSTSVPTHQEHPQNIQENSSLGQALETVPAVQTSEEQPAKFEIDINHQYVNEMVKTNAVDGQSEIKLAGEVNDVLADVPINEDSEMQIEEAQYEEVLVKESDMKHMRFKVSEPNSLQLASNSTLNNINKRLSGAGLPDIPDDCQEPLNQNTAIESLKRKPIVTSVEILPTHNMFNNCNNKNTLPGHKEQQLQLHQNFIPIKQQQIMHIQQLPVKKRPQQETKQKLQQYIQQQTAQSQLQQQPAQQPKIHLKNLKYDSHLSADKIFPPHLIVPEQGTRTLVTPTVSSPTQTQPRSSAMNIVSNNTDNQQSISHVIPLILSQPVKINQQSHTQRQSQSMVKNNYTTAAATLSSFPSRIVANIDNAICRITPSQYATRAWEDHEYHCDLEFYLEEANELISDNPMLEIPKWREIHIPMAQELVGEDVSDESYNNRHSKPVADEIRRKRADDAQTRLLMRRDRYDAKEILALPEDPPLETFYPEVYTVEEVCFVTKVPVQAFGECLVRTMKQSNYFSLPNWDDEAANTQNNRKKSTQQQRSSSYIFLKRAKRQRNHINNAKPRGTRNRTTNNLISSMASAGGIGMGYT